MTNKGFSNMESNINTQKDINDAKKPLKLNGTTSGRVDINVLKSKLQKDESAELKKNILILSVLVLLLAGLGIYLSL